jgi:predicted Zn finger-like uncharacterized protein
LKVTCKKCKASYLFNESKITDAGLKYKCPKCGELIILNKSIPLYQNTKETPSNISKNPLLIGIYAGAIGGAISSMPVMLYDFLWIGSEYTVFSLINTFLLSFFKMFYLGIFIGLLFAFINTITNIHMWSTAGGLFGIFIGFVIGLFSSGILGNEYSDVFLPWIIKGVIASWVVVFIKKQYFVSYGKESLSIPVTKQQIIALVLLLSLSIIPLSITAKVHYQHNYQHREEVPFFDGLFLEYEIGSKPRLYEVAVINENEYKITKHSGNSRIEYIIDKYGKIKEAKQYYADGRIKNKEKMEGEFLDIWKPIHKLKVGDQLSSRTTVDRTEKWKQWEVMVIKEPGAGRLIENYYEINTGFLVGSSFYNEVLIDTNAVIPTEE